MDALACLQLSLDLLFLAIHCRRCLFVLHVVPGAADATLAQQLHRQARHFALLADVIAEIVALLLKHGLTRDIDDEFITNELFDIGDAIVLLKQVSQAVLDAIELAHDLTAESLLAHLILLLEHNDKELGDRLQVSVRHRLKLRDLAELVALMRVVERYLIAREWLATNRVDHDGAVVGSRVDKVACRIDRKRGNTTDANGVRTERLRALIRVSARLLFATANNDHTVTTTGHNDLALAVASGDSATKRV